MINPGLKGILLFFFLTIAYAVLPQAYIFRNLSSENGLAQSYVYSIIQDEQGYLWVGTGNGLSRYNGLNFENFTIRDSLAENFVNCVIRDRQGIWFGHMNGQLSYFDGKKFHPVNLPQGNSSPVTHITKSNGLIWVSTWGDGLIELGKENGKPEQHLFKKQVFIISFEFINGSELLVGTDNGLLFCRIQKSGKIQIIRPVSEIPASKITCIREMPNKSGYYIATENEGIYQLTRQGRVLTASKIVTDPYSEFTGIQCLYEDTKSNIWLGSFGKGLIKLVRSGAGEKRKIIYFNKTNGFASDNIKSIFEDREGNIWSGSYGEGLTMISQKTFFVYDFANSRFGHEVFSICLKGKYKWIGTENGLIKMDLSTDKLIKFYSRGSGLPKDTVTTLYSGDGKELWIGTEKNGIFRMDIQNDRIVKFPLGNGILENSINALTGQGKQVWVGTKKGLCNIDLATHGTNWYSISQGGLPHNFINCLFLDSKGRLWITSHSNTLAYIRDKKVTKFPLIAEKGILSFGPVTEDSDSRIWVGSNGYGIFVIESDSVTNFTVKEGLLSDYCYSLISDDQHNILVCHKDGISKIKTTDFSVKPIKHIEGTRDSYQFIPHAIASGQNGRVWFGSDKGLILYDPSPAYQKYMPPVLGITSIEINDEKRDITDKIVLSPGNYKIRIDFLGILLKEPTLVTYQYKLDGYDQLTDISYNTSVTYNHLTYGNYTFILNASSGDGAVTENPLTISIIIKKPVWMKWWFYLLGVFLLMTLSYSYIKRNEYKFLAEKRILEEKVLERTYEIQCQKNEIELQKDMIDKRNANITSSITYAGHIQNAVLPPLELFNKWLPDNFIFSKPKDIVSGDFYWLAEKDGKIIFTVADCTGHGVPGAFMSLLGITLLNEVVNEEGITQSDAIVSKLREKVILSLQQSRKKIITTDGMDLALCVLDPQRNRIQYTGGMNDLVYIRRGTLKVVKADHFSVSALFEDSGLFTMKEIDCRKGDVFYLFSDGFQDQFGGDRDKKYLCRRFYNTLLEIHQMPMTSQKEILENKFYEWKQDKIQTDDITILGIRF